MTIYEFKRRYQAANPNGYFFSRDTMRFFGDTLRSFRVYKHDTGWRVVRVKGRHHEWLFDADFKQVH